MIGQNLLSPGYALRIVYFHKKASPELVGPRDGRWKYIVRRDDEAMELYDLEDDPTEQKDLAEQHPDKTELYRRLCASWLVTLDRTWSLLTPPDGEVAFSALAPGTYSLQLRRGDVYREEQVVLNRSRTVHITQEARLP